MNQNQNANQQRDDRDREKGQGQGGQAQGGQGKGGQGKGGQGQGGRGQGGGGRGGQAGERQDRPEPLDHRLCQSCPVPGGGYCRGLSLDDEFYHRRMQFEGAPLGKAPAPRELA